MNGEELFFKVLNKNGIKTVFGIAGREAEALSFRDTGGILFVLTKDERNAAIMADMQGRLTGKVGVCYSTFGPGASNLVTGVASAYMDRSPVLAISAQVEKATIHSSTHQCLNQVEMMRPITKYSKEIDKVDDLAKEINKAIEIAEEGLPGPCFLSIPLDIFKKTVKNALLPKANDKEVSGELKKDRRLVICRTRNKDLTRLQDMLTRSTFPIFIVGPGFGEEREVVALNKIISSFAAPSFATYAANGIISQTSLSYLGTVSKYLNDFRPGLLSEIFGHADLIVLIGVDMVEGLTSQLWEYGKTKKIGLVNSNFSKEIIHPSRRFDINASCPYILKIISEALAKKCLDPGVVRNLKEKIELMRNSVINKKFSSGINYFKIVDILNDRLKKNDILISDVGLHKQIVALFYKAKKPKTFFCSNGLGTMGFGLPAAIGAKKTFPRKRIIAVCGDGGFSVSSNELETSVRYRLPVICIVFSDGSFGLIRHYQKKGFKRFNPKVTDFGKLDFIKLARAHGCKGYRVKNELEFNDVLSKNLDTERTVLIEIPLNRADYLF